MDKMESRIADATVPVALALPSGVERMFPDAGAGRRWCNRSNYTRIRVENYRTRLRLGA